jgi:hypothetical protein
MATVIALGIREIPELVVVVVLAIAGLLFFWMVKFGETIRVTPLPPHRDGDDGADAGVREPRRPRPSPGTATAVADGATDDLTAQ